MTREPAAREKLEARWAAAVAGHARLLAYLGHRGLRSDELPEALRLAERETYWSTDDDGQPVDLGDFSAMIARVETLAGELVALHRTYLDPDGPGKLEAIDGRAVEPRKLTPAVREGATRGAAIHLDEPEGDALAVGEGIETMLAVRQATGVRAWACISAGGLEAVELPPHVKHVEVWADHDRPQRDGRPGAGQRAAEALADRLHRKGGKVRIILPSREGEDWLDVLRRDGEAALVEAAARAIRWCGSLDDVIAALRSLDEGVSVAAVEPYLRPVPGFLGNADRLAKATARAKLIEPLRAIKIVGATALIDAVLGGTATTEAPAGQGRALALEDTEPSDSPVDGVALLDGIMGAIKRHVVMSVSALRVTALWVLHTYFADALDVTPYLAVTSPEKRCGKTTLLMLLRALAYRALATVNISTASLFRAIEAARPTLLIDELDAFLAGDKDGDLIGALNAGNARGEAIVRCVGDDHEPREFRVFAPKAFGAIGALPATIADRSIAVRLERCSRAERLASGIARLRRRGLVERLLPLRRDAARWAADHATLFDGAEPSIPDELDDRAADSWLPLLVIADAVGGPWPQWAREAAVAISGGEGDTVSLAVLLLGDLRLIYDEDCPAEERSDEGAEHPRGIPSKRLIERLLGMDDRPWAEMGRARKPITPHRLARTLSRFDGVMPRTIRYGDSTPKGYPRAVFEEAWGRYVLPPGQKTPSGNATPPQPLRRKGKRRFSKRHARFRVAFRKGEQTLAGEGLWRCGGSERGKRGGGEK